MERRLQELLVDTSFCRSHVRPLLQGWKSLQDGLPAGSEHKECARCARTQEEAEYVKEANAKNIEMLTVTCQAAHSFPADLT
eukprot:748735-Hanusia_phi.AAC.4